MQVFFSNQHESVGWIAGYQCCITIYSFIGLGLILMAVFNQTIIMDEAPQFYKEWDSKMIQEIQILNQCDPDQINLMNFKWPGTIDGCDCRLAKGNGDFVYFKYDHSYQNRFYYMECSEQMISQGCLTATKLDSAQFKNWPLTTADANVQAGIIKIDSIAYKLCGKMNTLSLKQAFIGGQLKNQNFKLCGNNIQVPQNENCPIQAISLNEVGEGINISGQKQSYQITYVDGNKFPIHHFDVGFDQLCYETGNIKNFNYLDQLIEYECQTVDTKSIKISVLNDINYEQLLKANDKLTEYNYVYGSPDILESKINLFSTQFTSFNYNSQCTLDDLDFIYNLHYYLQTTIIDAQLTSEIVMAVLAGIFGFAIPLFTAISMVGCEFKYLSLGNDHQNYKDIMKFWLASNMFTEILCTVVLATNYGYQLYVMDNVDKFIDNSCADQITLNQLKAFRDEYSYRVYNYVLLDFILCLIAMCINFQFSYLIFREVAEQKTIQSVLPQQDVFPQNQNNLKEEQQLEKRALSDREIPNDDVVKHSPE